MLGWGGGDVNVPWARKARHAGVQEALPAVVESASSSSPHFDVRKFLEDDEKEFKISLLPVSPFLVRSRVGTSLEVSQDICPWRCSLMCPRVDHSVDTCCWDVPTSGKEGLMTDRFVGFNIHFPWSFGLIYQSQFKSNSFIWKILFSATQWSPDCLSWTKQVLVCRWVQWNWHHSVGVDLRWICMWDATSLRTFRIGSGSKAFKPEIEKWKKLHPNARKTPSYFLCHLRIAGCLERRETGKVLLKDLPLVALAPASAHWKCAGCATHRIFPSCGEECSHTSACWRQSCMEKPSPFA